jgi:hypothetical protein
LEPAKTAGNNQRLGTRQLKISILRFGGIDMNTVNESFRAINIKAKNEKTHMFLVMNLRTTTSLIR